MRVGFIDAAARADRIHVSCAHAVGSKLKNKGMPIKISISQRTLVLSKLLSDVTRRICIGSHEFEGEKSVVIRAQSE